VCTASRHHNRWWSAGRERDFSADFGFRPLFALFFSGRVRYFLWKQHEKADEKLFVMIVDISYNNPIENRRRIGGFAEETAESAVCKSLWKSYGDLVEKRLNARGKAPIHPYRALQRNFMEKRILTQDEVF
jgi:hypothetical protein